MSQQTWPVIANNKELPQLPEEAECLHKLKTVQDSDVLHKRGNIVEQKQHLYLARNVLLQNTPGQSLKQGANKQVK